MFFCLAASSFRRCRSLSSFILSLDQEQSQKRPLVLVSGFIHDVGSFIDEHPGGPHLLIKMIGKDATTAFFGGVYDHSNAAHNVSSCPYSLAPSLFLHPFLRIYFNLTHIPSLYTCLLTLSYITVARDEARGRS